jgi:hypothetical protein
VRVQLIRQVNHSAIHLTLRYAQTPTVSHCLSANANFYWEGNPAVSSACVVEKVRQPHGRFNAARAWPSHPYHIHEIVVHELAFASKSTVAIGPR